MRYATAACLLLAALIHLLPVAGVLGAERLQALYGVALDDPNLVLLMRHRALLFGIVGALLAAAAFLPALRTTALLVGGASALSFLALAWSSSGLNPAVTRVVFADIVAVLALGAAAVLHLSARGADAP
jgi:hypothetical protein